MSKRDDETPIDNDTDDVVPEYDLFERSEVNGHYDPPLIARLRMRFGRVGCVIGLVFWGVCLLLPLVAIALVVQNEIVINYSDAPGHELRIWLVMEARERGIGISNASIHTGPGGDDSQVCVETNVSFVFWQGSAIPTGYCECYTRPSEPARYHPLSTTQGACPT